MDKDIQKNLLSLVRSNYNEIAGEFDETRKKLVWPELEKLASSVKEQQSVLDVGCGNGRLLDLLPADVAYLGVDSSNGLISLARKNYQADTFKVGDILSLDKTLQDKFDFVFCIAVLHHLPGTDLQLQGLLQLKQRLKDDGRIILTVWNLWANIKKRNLLWQSAWKKIIGLNKLDFGDLVFTWGGGTKSERYYHAFTKRSLFKLIRQADLRIESFKKDDRNYYLVLKKKTSQ